MNNQKSNKHLLIFLCIVLGVFISPYWNKVVAQTQSALTESLFNAVENGNLEKVKDLISKGANVNAKNLSGSTTLTLGNSSATDNSSTALMIASNNGHTKIVNELISNGANVNEKTIRGITPLMIASNNGHTEIVKDLIAGGADINIKDTLNGNTPLLYSALTGHADVVEVLLQNGADINIMGGQWKLSLKKKADGEITDWANILIPNSLPVLFAAVKSGNFDVVLVLLKNGVDVNIKKNGETALSLATSEGHLEIVKLIKNINYQTTNKSLKFNPNEFIENPNKLPIMENPNEFSRRIDELYPEIAKRAGVEGIVTALTFIDEQGNVVDVQIQKRILASCDEVAKTVLMETKFQPGILNGTPVKVKMVVPVEFKF